jgi:hypothetical protein
LHRKLGGPQSRLGGLEKKKMFGPTGMMIMMMMMIIIIIILITLTTTTITIVAINFRDEAQ